MSYYDEEYDIMSHDDENEYLEYINDGWNYSNAAPTTNNMYSEAKLYKNPDLNLLCDKQKYTFWTECELCDLMEEYATDYKKYLWAMKVKKNEYKKTVLYTKTKKEILIKNIKSMFNSDKESQNKLISMIEKSDVKVCQIYDFGFDDNSFDDELNDHLEKKFNNESEESLDNFFVSGDIQKNSREGYMIYKLAKKKLLFDMQENAKDAEQSFRQNGRALSCDNSKKFLKDAEFITDKNFYKIIKQFCKEKGMSGTSEVIHRIIQRIKNY
jgi:hypothetical protein